MHFKPNIYYPEFDIINAIQSTDPAPYPGITIAGRSTQERMEVQDYRNLPYTRSMRRKKKP